MLRLLRENSKLCDGLSRREWLRVGGLSVGGLSLASLIENAARAGDRPSGNGFGRAKSVIVFGLVGGPPQHETWDPKPEAPAEIRGEFGTIATKTPGLRVGELMPKTAALTDKIAVLRAVVTGDNSHSSSGYQMLTGVPHQPLSQENARPKAPNLSPSLGAITRALRDQPGRLPAAITLPDHIWNDGNIPWPGQDAGLLGRRYDPWILHCKPHEDSFQVPGLSALDGVPSMRVDGRRRLLDQMNSKLARLPESPQVRNYSVHASKALDLISGSAREAFDLRRESDSMRDRYGRSRFAQSVLLARRLIESGVSLVQVNWTRVKGFPNNGGWDIHKEYAKSAKELLMPTMDQAFSALLEDLETRGLLDETLVLWFGEFGHTPKINKNAGRDHWGSVFSLAMAGGGVQGGVVHGVSDKHAAFPVDGVVRAKDILATVFHCLGFHPETEIHDPFGRPIPVSRGRVIDAIL